MNNHPEITVVMPVFNTELYLDQAIESVLCQTFDHFELLAINDGSTDGSLSRLEYWASKDQRLRVVSQRNLGLSGARNTGIKLAKGDFIYFMDSDDMIAKDTLSLCYAYCKRDQLDFAFFDAETFGHGIQYTVLVNNFNYKRTHIGSEIMSGSVTLEKLLKFGEFFSSVCLLFIDGNFLREKRLLFEMNIVHEDELFTSILFLEAKRIRHVPVSFFMRRLRSDSIMTVTYSMKNINSYFAVGTKLLEYAVQNPMRKKIVDCYLEGMLNAAVWKAHAMPLKNRVYIFNVCIRRWWKYVKVKTLFALLLKKYKLS